MISRLEMQLLQLGAWKTVCKLITITIMIGLARAWTE